MRSVPDRLVLPIWVNSSVSWLLCSQRLDVGTIPEDHRALKARGCSSQLSRVTQVDRANNWRLQSRSDLQGPTLGLAIPLRGRFDGVHSSCPTKAKNRLKPPSPHDQGTCQGVRFYTGFRESTMFFSILVTGQDAEAGSWNALTNASEPLDLCTKQAHVRPLRMSPRAIQPNRVFSPKR